MRRILPAFGTMTALLLFATLSPNHASAMTLPAPAGINSALADHTLTEEVRYVCRRRCGPYGCTRRCWWTGGPGYRPYGAYRPYRGYYRPHRYYRPYRPYRPYRSYRW